jgi:hypothetical protein
MPHDFTALLIVLPARADEIAAHHGFERQRLQAFHHHRATGEQRPLVRVESAAASSPSDELWFGTMWVVRANQKFEISVRTRPLLRNRIGQHDVEGGQSGRS